MKKTMLLTLALGLASTASVMASNFDIYISGSTAFRKQAYAACSKMFDTAQTGNDGTAGVPSSGDTTWTMSGASTVILGNNTDTLTIHAVWTGSVQGLSAMLNKDSLTFLVSGVQGNTATVTHTATAAFSDVFSLPTLDPLPSGSFSETPVAVQPFVFVRSRGPGPLQNLQNINYQQVNSLLASFGGFMPLSLLDGNINDAATNVFLVHRSLDSGTRVTTVQEAAYIGSVVVNYCDTNGNTGFSAATTNMGPAQFGPGYVGGGDVKNVLNNSSTANQSVGYLSFADAQGVGASNWANILSYNGVYPILNYTNGVTYPTTNDFSPILNGKYSFWATEIVASPKSAQYATYTDQNIGFAKLTTFVNKLAGTGAGSINNEIANSGSLRTAINLGEMNVNRQAVGGVINPN